MQWSHCFYFWPSPSAPTWSFYTAKRRESTSSHNSKLLTAQNPWALAAGLKWMMLLKVQNKLKPILVCPVLSHFSHVFATPQTIACQPPLSKGFSRQEYWSGLLCPPPRVLPKPGFKAKSLTWLALAGGFFTTSTTWEVPYCFLHF